MDIAELKKKIKQTVEVYSKTVERIKNEGSTGSGKLSNNQKSG